MTHTRKQDWQVISVTCRPNRLSPLTSSAEDFCQANPGVAEMICSTAQAGEGLIQLKVTPELAELLRQVAMKGSLDTLDRVALIEPKAAEARVLLPWEDDPDEVQAAQPTAQPAAQPAAQAPDHRQASPEADPGRSTAPSQAASASQATSTSRLEVGSAPTDAPLRPSGHAELGARTTVHVHGSASPQTGSAGMGLVASWEKGTTLQEQRSSPAEAGTSCNLAELMAALMALRLIASGHPTLAWVPETAVICSASDYLITGMNDWVHGWARKGWPSSVKNKLIWQALCSQLEALERSGCQVSWKNLKDHPASAQEALAGQLASRLASEARRSCETSSS